MTRHHFDPSELDRPDEELEGVAERLAAYADEVRGDPPVDLPDRILGAIDAEPDPRPGLLGWVAALRRPAGALAAVAVVLVAVTGALVFGELVDRARVGDDGPSPSSMPTLSASPSPSPTPSPSPSPSPTLSPSPSPSAVPTLTPEPTATDDDDDDDEFETPEPDESDDSSGPGSGDDRSGPGG